MNMKKILSVLAFAAAILIASCGGGGGGGGGAPGPGSLDTTFGTGGKVITNMGNDDNELYAAAMQPDGKTVVAGYALNGAGSDFALARFNANGSLDTTFGSRGKVITPMGAGISYARAVAIQSDGKIVVAGTSLDGVNPDFALARYNEDGTLDATFDTDGKVTTAIGIADDEAFALAIQSDGKIVAAGYSSNGTNDDFALVRYNADGSLDTTFDSDGIVTTAMGNSIDYARAVAIQSDGKIVAAGFALSGSGYDVALARYNADGSLDTTFDGDGKVIDSVSTNLDDGAYAMAIRNDGNIFVAGFGSANATTRYLVLGQYGSDGSFVRGSMYNSFDMSSDAYALAFQSDGKIVVAGSLSDGVNGNMILLRFDTDLKLDRTFGTYGEVVADKGSPSYGAVAVSVRSDGKIVVAGNAYLAGKDFALMRYTADGKLDATFGAGGTVTCDIKSSSNAAQAAAVQPDGKIVVAGYASISGTDNFALARYNADGSLDAGFDADGKATTAMGSGDYRAYAVAVQPDGKIVAAGYSHNGSGYDFALARFNEDGALDATFGTGGKVTTEMGTSGDRAFAVAIQADGRIVVAGMTDTGLNSDFALARYNANGTLDTTFGTGGKVTTGMVSANEAASALAIQSDGKIVAAGFSYNGSDFDFALVRYNADGSPDTTFDTDGKVTTDMGTSEDLIRTVAVQADGKIVAAGYAKNSGRYEFALARYNADGSLDTSFGAGGKTTTPIGSGDGRAQAAAIQPDGKIVVTGYASNGTGDDFALARYNANGSLDAAFGAGGKVTTDIGPSRDGAQAVAIQADGKIVVAGYAYDADGNYSDFAVARYLP